MNVPGFETDLPATTSITEGGTVRLAFEAGRLAEARRLDACLVVGASQVDTEPPSGPPLVVTAQRGELSEALLRSVAALHGAGRKVLVVSMDPVDEGATWLADDLVHVVGSPFAQANVAAVPEEPPAPSYDPPPAASPPPRPPHFSDLRLFAGVRPDPIGEAAQRWQQLRQDLRWSLEEVPLAEEGAYAWFGVWPLEPGGPAALIRFQPYEFAGVQVLQVESAIGQVAATSHALERVGSSVQQQFAVQVTMQCEPDALRANSTAAWTSEDPPAAARAIILDAEPPLPLANTHGRLAARMTVGSSGVDGARKLDSFGA